MLLTGVRMRWSMKIDEGRIVDGLVYLNYDTLGFAML